MNVLVKYSNGFDISQYDFNNIIFDTSYYSAIYLGNSTNKPQLIANRTLFNVTYSKLIEILNNNLLLPGARYRITDYETIVSGDNINSAGHKFDIIVTALSSNTLSENASCIHNENDDYFSNSNLSAWEVKYTIYNDTDHYLWANTNGKGVIYYMKEYCKGIFYSTLFLLFLSVES